LHFFRKRQDESAPFFFQNLGEITCSLQSALKSNAPGLKCRLECWNCAFFTNYEFVVGRRWICEWRWTGWPSCFFLCSGTFY